MANAKKTPAKKKTARKSRKGIPSPNKGKTLINFKDVQLAYMSDGVDGVRARHAAIEGGLSKKVIYTAINNMPASQDVEPLRALATELVGAETGEGSRGRSAASVGENRTYKAQQVQEGGVFLRLPLDVLNATKGGPINVSFEDGRIVVTSGTAQA